MEKNSFDFFNIIKYLDSSSYFEQFNFIDVMRDVDNLNPYDNLGDLEKNILWREQCVINFPILYLSSIYLHIYAKRKRIKKFLFATRDCSHWYKVYGKLFPNDSIYYFDCSRVMFESALRDDNTYYRRYVESIIGSTSIDEIIFVDIHGSCKRVIEYFKTTFGHVPHCILLSARYKKYKKFPKISKKYIEEGKVINLCFDVRGSPIEMLNYDNIGTLKTYNTYGPVRDELEYKHKLISPYHKCVDQIIQKLKPIKKSHVDDLMTDSKHNLSILHDAIKHMTMIIQNDKPILANYFHHIGSHKKEKKKKN